MSDDNVTATTDPLAEVTAMGKVAEALAGLDADATGRVLRWAIDRYGVAAHNLRGGTGVVTGSRQAALFDNSDNNGDGSQGGGGTAKFNDLAELYAATSPESESDKTLVGGYWFQFCEGKQELTSQEINTALKNLGHPIKNITTAFDTLKARKPASVMQLKKSGSSKQARKTYRLTHAGKQAVEMMIAQH